MNETLTLQGEREKRDNREISEFIEILKTLTDSEKQQVKGIMIGIQLAKTDKPA